MEIWHLIPRSNWNRKHKKGIIGTTAEKNLFQLKNYNRGLEIENLNEIIIKEPNEKILIEKFLYWSDLDPLKLIKKIFEQERLKKFILALISKWSNATPAEKQKLKIFFLLIKQKRPDLWEKIKKWFK